MGGAVQFHGPWDEKWKLFAICCKDRANRPNEGEERRGARWRRGVIRPLSVLRHDLRVPPCRPRAAGDELNHFVACVITNCSLIRSIRRHSSILFVMRHLPLIITSGLGIRQGTPQPARERGRTRTERRDGAPPAVRTIIIQVVPHVREESAASDNAHRLRPKFHLRILHLMLFNLTPLGFMSTLWSRE